MFVGPLAYAIQLEYHIPLQKPLFICSTTRMWVIRIYWGCFQANGIFVSFPPSRDEGLNYLLLESAGARMRDTGEGHWSTTV